jgi:hypothetical protein
MNTGCCAEAAAAEFEAVEGWIDRERTGQNQNLMSLADHCAG